MPKGVVDQERGAYKTKKRLTEVRSLFFLPLVCFDSPFSLFIDSDLGCVSVARFKCVCLSFLHLGLVFLLVEDLPHLGQHQWVARHPSPQDVEPLDGAVQVGRGLVQARDLVDHLHVCTKKKTS